MGLEMGLMAADSEILGLPMVGSIDTVWISTMEAAM